MSHHIQGSIQKSRIHEQRWEQERLVHEIDTLLEQVITGIPLSEKIQARKVMVAAGITRQDVARLAAENTLGEHNTRVQEAIRRWRGM